MHLKKTRSWSTFGVAIAAVVALTVTLAGCASGGQKAPQSSSSASTSPASTTLTIGTTTQVQSLDPRDANDTLGLNLVANFNGSLYRANPDVSGKPIPELAVG